MPCPICGDICRCPSDAYSAAPPRWLPDTDPLPDSATPPASLEAQEAVEPSAPAHAEPAERGESGVAEDSSAWRLEVSQRFNRYQARRKPRPPRYPSLRLRFEIEDSNRSSDSTSVEPCAFPQMISTISNRALALDGFADHDVAAPENAAFEPSAAPEVQPALSTAVFPHSENLPRNTSAPTTVPTTAPTTAKIIEFPRSWTPPAAPLNELAGPVMGRPRILEAPEVVPPPPALGGITIEPVPQPEFEKRPGIDIPLQSARLGRRILSAFLDGIIIVAACALFGFIFSQVTAIRPPRFQWIGLAAGLSVLFWAAYQYLLLVYSGTTPGLRLARLELARFDGSPATRSLRRWRVLASFLSAASLGMGYAWVFLDEDSLCWHDRITHTYLAPKQHAMAAKKDR